MFCLLEQLQECVFSLNMYLKELCCISPGVDKQINELNIKYSQGTFQIASAVSVYDKLPQEFVFFFWSSEGCTHLWHMEVPKLGVEWEPQMLTYATANAIATATWDPSHVFDLQHSSQQCWILNPPKGQTSAWQVVCTYILLKE